MGLVSANEKGKQKPDTGIVAFLVIHGAALCLCLDRQDDVSPTLL